MKRILALVLALIMLGSVTAFAADLTVGDQPATAPSFKVDGNTATQHTDLWLQVEAAGQIDVTVPLLLVFKTNIDGGTATPPTDYNIMNKSTAPLAVTSVVVTYEAQGDDNPMTLTNYSENGDYDEDHYGVQLGFSEGTVNAGVTINLAGGTHNGTAHTYTHTENEPGAGLFVLPKATAPTGSATEYAASKTDVVVNMGTGKLSFVTKHKDAGDNRVLDEDQGVKLLSITYTVAIKSDDDSAKGKPMEGSTNGSQYIGGKLSETLVPYSYKYPAP